MQPNRAKLVRVKKTRSGRYHLYIRGMKHGTYRSKESVTRIIQKLGLNHG